MGKRKDSNLCLSQTNLFNYLYILFYFDHLSTSGIRKMTNQPVQHQNLVLLSGVTLMAPTMKEKSFLIMLKISIIRLNLKTEIPKN